MIKGLNHVQPCFLASVKNGAEAHLALAGGAGLIDCKNPSEGALGALEAIAIRSVVDAVAGRVRVSATIGDLPSDPSIMVTAAALTAAAGADIVKVGFFGDADPRGAIAALGAADIGSAQLVAVLMADREPDFAVVAALARAKFAGVMLDTADKSRGALPDILPPGSLAEFVAIVQKHGLVAGLAGSLRVAHVAGLVALQPDVIGFRGELCDGGRTGGLSAARVGVVRDAIDSAISKRELTKRSAGRRRVA